MRWLFFLAGILAYGCPSRVVVEPEAPVCTKLQCEYDNIGPHDCACLD